MVDQALADFVSHDDGAVYQQPQRNHQAGNRHLVDRNAGVIEHGDGKQRAKGQDTGNYHRSAPTHSEQQHQQYQQHAEREVGNNAAQALLGVNALIVADLDTDAIRRQCVVAGHKIGEIGGPAVDLQAVLHRHANQDTFCALHQNPRGRRCGARAVHIGNVAYPYRGTIRRGAQ